MFLFLIFESYKQLQILATAFIKMRFLPEVQKDHKHYQRLKIYRRFSPD